MTVTTIQVDKSTREKLAEFKMPGESFNDLLLRLYRSASERQLQDILMDNSDSFTLNEAREYVLKNG